MNISYGYKIVYFMHFIEMNGLEAFCNYNGIHGTISLLMNKNSTPYYKSEYKYKGVVLEDLV